ncbi:galectin-8-like [Festucalex cinctus]
MPISYPRHEKPYPRDQCQSREHLIPAEDGVKTWHVAVLVGLMLSILVAILVLVPIYTVDSGSSLDNLDSTMVGGDYLNDLNNTASDDEDEEMSYNKFLLSNFSGVNWTQLVALEIVNEMSRMGKIAIEEPVANVSLCSAENVTCAQKVEMKRDDVQGYFFGELVGGLSVGRSIAITGRIGQKPDRFEINLMLKDGRSKALHLNPRFQPGTVFVRNSFLSGFWGSEERQLTTTFPFAAGQFFEMIIWCDTNAFNVTVNGVHQLDYEYRTSLDMIGSVRVSNIELAAVMQM